MRSTLTIGPNFCDRLFQNSAKKWTMPLQNWNLTLSQLAIYFDGRLDDVLDI